MLQAPHGHQSLLNKTMAELEKYVPNVAATERRLSTNARVDVDACVSVHEFPVGPFNAQVRPVPGAGYLILINRGVLALLAHTTRLIGQSTRLTKNGFQDIHDVGIGLRGSTPAEALAGSRVTGVPRPSRARFQR